jgi:hypothetical protein
LSGVTIVATSRRASRPSRQARNGRSSPVVVCQPQALHTDLSPKKAILFNEISHRLPLPAIEPADDSEEQQLESRDVDHERQPISRTR